MKTPVSMFRVVLRVLVVAAGLSGIAYAGDQPSWKTDQDAVSRAIRYGRFEDGRVSLIPAPFATGMDGRKVVARLKSAGYEPDGRENFSFDDPQKIPQGSLHYSKTLMGSCIVVYEVVVTMDDAGKLADAYGTAGRPACS